MCSLPRSPPLLGRDASRESLSGQDGPGPPFPKDKMALGPKPESVQRSLRTLETSARGEAS